jgi:YVTN family beta-propeller protein
VVNLSDFAVTGHISVGLHPTGMAFYGQYLLVANTYSDSISVIDITTKKVAKTINLGLPIKVPGEKHAAYGAGPNSIAVDAVNNLAYVALYNANAVAVVDLASDQVLGLIPVGYAPSSVVLDAADGELLVANDKGIGTTGFGVEPPPQNTFENSYNTYWGVTDLNTHEDLGTVSMVPVPVPSTTLAAMTTQVTQNNHWDLTENIKSASGGNPKAQPVAIPAKIGDPSEIKHVFVIIRENRTYDQILGDLPVGDGDPAITQFGAAITPNLHALASNFVDFDNFFDVSEVSGDGWPWSTSARTTDTIEKEIPVNYANRGGDDNAEGTNRNINMGIGNFAARTAADPLGAVAGDTEGGAANLLPGTGDVAAPDSSEGGIGEGYIWNAVNKAGLSIRDYGMFIDLARYDLPTALAAVNIPEDPTPFQDSLQVSYSTSPFLAPLTDIYFRGFDNSFPDYYRFQEWNREFQQFDTNGNLPALSLVRLMHDHTGNFSASISGVNTPELDEADNDYAVGLLVEAVANSKNYRENTLIFSIEDDSQDGGDHVDAHRSIAFIAGPYVKHGAVVSHFYNTVSILRTIEDILGTPHLNQNDANALPMTDAFDLDQKRWSFTAVPSALLAGTTLPIPASAFSASALNHPPKPLHDSVWWANATRGMDFSVEDHLDSMKYNHLLWTGTMGDKPYPAMRSGLDLRLNRAELLKHYYEHQAAQSQTSDREQKTATVDVPTGSSM